MSAPAADSKYSFKNFQKDKDPNSFRNFERNVDPEPPTNLLNQPRIVLSNPKFDESTLLGIRFLHVTQGEVLIVQRDLGATTFVRRVCLGPFGHVIEGWVPSACFNLLGPEEVCDCVRAYGDHNCICVRIGTQRADILERGLPGVNNLEDLLSLASQTVLQPMMASQGAI